MTISPAKNLQSYVEELLGTHQLLDCFQQTKDFSATIGISGSRPLHIQRSASKITVAQYNHAGDEILPDPEMIFHLNEDGQWLPTEARFANGASSNCTNGSWLSNFRERLYIQALASRWLSELQLTKYDCGEVLDLWGENA